MNKTSKRVNQKLLWIYTNIRVVCSLSQHRYIFILCEFCFFSCCRYSVCRLSLFANPNYSTHTYRILQQYCWVPKKRWIEPVSATLAFVCIKGGGTDSKATLPSQKRRKNKGETQFSIWKLFNTTNVCSTFNGIFASLCLSQFRIKFVGVLNNGRLTANSHNAFQ